MKKRNLLLVILAVLLVFGMVVGCGPAEDDGTGGTGGGGGGTTTPTRVTFNNVTADNGSIAKATKNLTLTFSAAITGLSADDITLSGVTGVTKGTLTNSGATYTLPISGFTDSGSLTVAVSKANYTITTPSKPVDITGFDIYFDDFRANYGKRTGSQDPISEWLKISKTTINFEDNETSVTDPDNLVFSVTKWEDGGTVPSSVATAFPLNGTNTISTKPYTVAVKISGTITSAKPAATATASPYGNNTCPGIRLSDIGTTPVYIYLYFTEEEDTDDLMFVRSAFFKEGVTGQLNPITVREYLIP